nr:zinc-ribbon domain-containing protein [Lachnospiraceae bacterium]
MFCKYCGKEIADESTFCKFCGKMLSDTNDIAKEAVDTGNRIKKGTDSVIQKTDNKKQNKKLILGIAGVAFAVMVFAIIISSNNKGNSNNIENQNSGSNIENTGETSKSTSEVINVTNALDGISPDYKQYSFQMDPQEILDQYYKKGYDHVYLKEHEINVPDGKKMGDGGTTDKVTIIVSYTDPNGLYSFEEEHLVGYYWWGTGTGWVDSAKYIIPEGTNYNLEGFNGTVWKLYSYPSDDSMVQAAKWILEKEMLEKSLEGENVVFHEAIIYFKLKNMGQYRRWSIDSKQIIPADKSSTLSTDIMDVTIVMDGQEYNLSLPVKDLFMEKSAQLWYGTTQTYKDVLSFRLENNFDFAISDYERNEFPSDEYVVRITEDEMKKEIEEFKNDERWSIYGNYAEEDILEAIAKDSGY